jgi:aminoglycoside/choline kinase family phosphotransferase
MQHERIIRLFTEHFGTPPSAVVEMRADGSNRTYFRLIDDGWRTAVGAIGPDHDENRAFLSYSRDLRAAGLPVPEIYGADEDAGVWIEEDLGDTTLFDAVVEARERESGPFPASMLPVYRRVVEILPRFQVEGGRVIDYSVAYPRAAFDRQSILWDLNYFKYHFLKLAHIPFNEARLEEDFDRLADFLLAADTRHFLYRDFQSRNIMLRDGEPWFLDYQGGRRGAPHYDIASLLYDAKAGLPDEIRDELLEHYLDALGEHLDVDRERFRQEYRGYVLVRIMQAMGAYGYRGFFERKIRFLQSVPYAANNLQTILERGQPQRQPELGRVFRRIADGWAPGDGEAQAARGLTVYTGSFSFKRGYPQDVTGHGGGFVFDCRALPNPGRHLEYASLCGRDREVVAFIENCPEVGAFWENVRALVDTQVDEYLRRGFTSLTVLFGCTGGQHRSVYMAERLARHLRESGRPINVRVSHHEERVWGPDPSRAAASA